MGNIKILVAVLIVLGGALGVFIYLYMDLSQDNQALASELESNQNALTSTQAELASAQAELADTNDTLEATRAELGDTADTLTATLARLSDTEEILSSKESELEDANQELVTRTAELSSANSRIDNLQETVDDLEDSLADSNGRLAIAEETLDGLGITVASSTDCSDVELIDNPDARNPTWQELMQFLTSDRTETHEYILDVYDCSQFSRDIHNNAEAAGIRAAEVQLWFSNQKAGHALNAFITTDYGLVYIDCTTPPDNAARVKLDKEYRAIETFAISGKNARNDVWWDSLWYYYYIGADTGGHAIVSDIKIYW